MKLTAKERLVLAGVLRDREAIAALDWKGDGVPRERLGALRLRIDAARAGLVPMNLAGWIGHAPSPSEAVMYHRAYARLEAAGLMERHRLGGTGRTSHLELTPAGEAMARSLAEGGHDLGWSQAGV